MNCLQQSQGLQGVVLMSTVKEQQILWLTVVVYICVCIYIQKYVYVCVSIYIKI